MIVLWRIHHPIKKMILDSITGLCCLPLLLLSYYCYSSSIGRKKTMMTQSQRTLLQSLSLLRERELKRIRLFSSLQRLSSPGDTILSKELITIINITPGLKVKSVDFKNMRKMVVNLPCKIKQEAMKE